MLQTHLPDQPGSDQPQLMGPQKLSAPRALGAASALALVGIAYLAISGGIASGPSTNSKLGGDGKQGTRIISVDAEDVRGFMTTLPSDIAIRNDNAVASLNIAEHQKDAVRSQLQRGKLRMGSVSVWDSEAEDGDEIRISAAGIDQVVSISNTPRTFLVPHIPGGTVRITGTRDGQGGVTLGIKTMLGPVYLPRLAVGEAVELPIQ